MPHDETFEQMRQAYRDGQIDISASGAVTDVAGRVSSRARRNRPGETDDPLEAARRAEQYMEAALRVRAEEAIRKVWDSEGGPKSSLGLPQEADVVAQREGEDWSARFRSGKITVKSHQCDILTTNVLRVEFVGLECNVRQESTDEVYGVVALIGPGNRVLTTHAFPGGDNTLEMGPDGQRLWTTNVELYKGPIEDVVLVATLVEHDDFADVDGAARQIATQIAEKGGQLLGALTGLPAEAVTNETWFQDGLAAGLGVVMDDILGMGDDAYPGQSLKVPWDEILNGPPRQPPRTRGDDPKVIPTWTHRVKVTGRDDGDDYGDYDFYFNFSVDRIDISRNCPVPPHP